MTFPDYTARQRTPTEIRASLALLQRAPTISERIILNTDASRHQWREADRELLQAGADREARAARRPVASTMPDAELRDLAQRRAVLMGELIDGITSAMTPAGLLAWLNGALEPLQGRPFRFECDRPHSDQLRGFLARARCPMWWRRQLRRECVRMREREGRAAGEVCATRRQPYVTTDTARRHQQRAAATAAMMEATELENDAGQVATLADLAAASTSNKAIRRGELMTRIRGCEGIAEAFGWRGVFLTLTAPSRFHAMHRHGERNSRHDGSTPKDAHEWLCATWAKARARLQRIGVQVFGFRVAEPHHDGTPHWHALLWAKPGELWRLVLTLRRWWQSVERRPMAPIHARACKARSGWEKGAGGLFTDLGARRYRVKAVLMHAGGASGYIAKYVAKNIDDAGSVGRDGHTDDGLREGSAAAGVSRGWDDDGGDEQRGLGAADVRQPDLFGGTAKRVEAWASAWGIRQFQAIGQPPVTVWRELRRIPEQARQGATDRMRVAFEAVNREAERRADWARYVLAQGGMGTGRGYLLRIERAARVVAGRYETHEIQAPIGVTDTTGPGDLHPSERRQWRPRGAWPERMTHGAANALRVESAAGGGGAARRPPGGAPWTRVNNCTHRNPPTMVAGRLVDFRALLKRAAGLAVARNVAHAWAMIDADANRGTGRNPERPQPCAPPK